MFSARGSQVFDGFVVQLSCMMWIPDVRSPPRQEQLLAGLGVGSDPFFRPPTPGPGSDNVESEVGPGVWGGPHQSLPGPNRCFLLNNRCFLLSHLLGF